MTASSTSATAPAYAPSTASRSAAAASSCSASADSTGAVRRGRLSSAPASVRRTSSARACASAARPSSHGAHGRQRRGREPAGLEPRLGDDEQRRVAQAVLGEHALQVRADVAAASSGTRSSTTDSAVPRSRAACRRSQGTASA